VSEYIDWLTQLIGRIFCLLGVHKFTVIDATLGFGYAGEASALQCRRCGLLPAAIKALDQLGTAAVAHARRYAYRQSRLVDVGKHTSRS